MKTSRSPVQFFFVLIAACVCGWSQQDRGVIAGVVSDPSGGRMPGASVTVTNRATGETRLVRTGSSGDFVAAALQVGRYDIAVEAKGFQKLLQTDVPVQVQQRVDLNLALKVSNSEAVVLVNASPTPLQTSDSSLGQVITSSEIVGMPLNGRDVYQLVGLAPGVVTENDGLPALSGQPGQQQGYVLDGVDNNNYQIIYTNARAGTVGPSPDAVEEFKVQTGNYSAEFGQAGGGVINVVTKSGTNQFHGAMYEFLRNDKVAARPFFAESSTPYKRNQFGVTSGGPVLIPKLFNGRNQLFYFADYEGDRERSVNASSPTVVPSLQHRAGDFRDLLTGSTFTDPCTGQQFDTGQLFDPNTTRAVHCLDGSTGYARNPVTFNGQANVLNPASIVLPASKTLALLPSPNVGSNQFYWTPHTVYNYDKYDIKVDYQLSERDRLTWRYDHFNSPLSGTPALPGPASPSTLNRAYSNAAGFSEIHIFSPTIVNEFRFGYQYNKGEVVLAGAELDPASLGYGGLTYSKGLLGGVPTLNISDAGTSIGAAAWAPSLYTGYANNFLDTLSLSRGKHSFRLGGALDRVGSAQYQSPDPLGQYSFSGVLTSDLNAPSVSQGSGMAQFLFGVPNNSQISTATLSALTRLAASAFIQDDWKITPTLTVNLGLRWEGGTTLHEDHDRFTGIDLATGAFVIPYTRANREPQLPMGVAVEYTHSTSLMQAYNKSFGPRVGLAYQLDHKTVVRSAFGIFYANPYEEGSTGYNLNPPWGSQINISTPNTGPYDPVTHVPVTAVTSITSGFVNAQSALAGLISSSTLSVFDRAPRYPYTLNWNFALQRQVGWQTTAEAAYNGTEGNHILAGYDPNQSYPSADPNSDPVSRRPYPNFGPLSWVGSGAKSSYNALLLKLEKRYSSGLSFLIGYTWSHSIDDAPLCVMAGNQAPYDCYRNGHDLDIDRSNSGFDVRQRFTASWQYDLPFGRGRTLGSTWGRALDLTFGGWELTGIQSWQTGIPYTPVTYYDPGNSPTYSGAARAEVTGNPYDYSGCPGGRRSISCWVNPNAFGFAPPGQFGNADRNVLRGPNSLNVDFGLYKSFSLTEDVKLLFRSEFFNALNHPNFGLPGAAWDDSSNFGVIRYTTSSPRQLQFALKLNY